MQLLALVIAAAGFPETAGRELEQTSAEPGGATLHDNQAPSHTPLPGIGSRYRARPLRRR